MSIGKEGPIKSWTNDEIDKDIVAVLFDPKDNELFLLINGGKDAPRNSSTFSSKNMNLLKSYLDGELVGPSQIAEIHILRDDGMELRQPIEVDSQNNFVTPLLRKNLIVMEAVAFKKGIDLIRSLLLEIEANPNLDDEGFFNMLTEPFDKRVRAMRKREIDPNRLELIDQLCNRIIDQIQGV